MKKGLVVAALPALLVACSATPEQLGQSSDAQVCAIYGQGMRVNNHETTRLAQSEMTKRGLDVIDALPQIGAQKVRIGMTTCALYASWGIPDRENRSVGSWGTSIQHVYGRRQYVYSRNGRVTSFQD